MVYADARNADNTRPQIAILEQAFRQLLNRASLQKALPRSAASGSPALRWQRP